MVTRVFLLVCLATTLAKGLPAQENCSFAAPFFHMHFGKGEVPDVNSSLPVLYSRTSSPCPTDGHYSFTSYTANCFRGDWHTLSEDHTPGDVAGNMLLVNSAYNNGVFFTTKARGFKGGKTYQFGVWLMNVCRPTRKCPFPLLPNLTIRLQTLAGKTIARFRTGEIGRQDVPEWTMHKAQFTMPDGETELVITLVNNAPGGCGNDFAMDDLTFRECVVHDPAKLVQRKKVPEATAKTKPDAKKIKKQTVPQTPAETEARLTTNKNNGITPFSPQPFTRPQPVPLVPVPVVLKQRTNTVVQEIETGEGELRLDLYDNGEIDGDTVSIYHNNKLVVDRQLLSQKPISFRIQVNKNQPRHELVMVANNLGAIPPNTSMMIVTANEIRHQVFISSTTQQNATVVIVLKE